MADSEGSLRPLFAASQAGHEGIVKLLLKRKEVNPDSGNLRGETPLFGAASRGHEGIVKVLLERKEVNPDSCMDGRTRLWEATRNGKEGAVRLLLERKEVNPDSSSNYVKPPSSEDWDTDEY